MADVKDILLEMLGEASAEFMSSPSPGVEQVMPTERLVDIADTNYSRIMVAIGRSSQDTDDRIAELERELEKAKERVKDAESQPGFIHILELSREVIESARRQGWDTRTMLADWVEVMIDAAREAGEGE